MFKGLRLQLTLLYLFSALTLIGLVGGGGYVIVARYFQDVTDLALQHKMAHEFHSLDAPLPSDLIPADRDWSIVRQDAAPLGRAPQPVLLSEAQVMRIVQQMYGHRKIERIKLDNEDGQLVYDVYFADASEIYVDAYRGEVLTYTSDDAAAAIQQSRDRDDTAHGRPTALDTARTTVEIESYDAEIAAIFVLPLNAQGQLLLDPGPYAFPLTPNMAAFQNAIANGSDLRTTIAPDGQQIRILTYKLTRDDGPAALQLGRTLTDQEHVLRQLLLVVLVLSGVSIVLLGAGSWWLAGSALQPAQQAWERQQTFIANASHELRTPLTLIRASTEVALRSIDPDDSNQREVLGDVLVEADHMRRLVDDLLILSRLDSGSLQIERHPLDLRQFLDDIQRQVERMSTEQGIRVNLGQIAGSVLADDDRLRQVLLILLDNAIRHTPAGGQITLSAAVHGATVQIEVADEGCGIPPEHLPHIFERFYRADAARGVSNNAGLGLPIAKGLIEAQRGKIRIASTLDRGTTITLTLQAASS